MPASWAIKSPARPVQKKTETRGSRWSAAKGFKGRRHGEVVIGEDGLDAAFRDFGRVVRPEQVNTRFMGNKNVRASGSEEDGRAGYVGQ